MICLSSINCFKIYECLVMYIYTNKRVLSLETRIVWRHEKFGIFPLMCFESVAKPIFVLLAGSSNGS